MSWQIAAHMRAASADWDVEAALQKELDAVSVCSHISSHSSATGAEETFPAEDEADRTSSPLHKLLDNWRIKKWKLQSFETMLSGTQSWNYDILDEIGDEGQQPRPRPSLEAPETFKNGQGNLDPVCRSRQPASKDKDSSQITSMTFSETSTNASSFFQQRRTDFNCPRSDISEKVERTTESQRQSQENETMPSILISDSTSQDLDSADVKTTRPYEGENDFPYCSMDYEDALSMLRKKRLGILEEYAVEAERFVEKNLTRLTETEESRKILLLASQRRQELENEIWEEKQAKIAQLDLELAKQIEFFEKLQRTTERELKTQIQDIDCRSRSVTGLVDTNEHQAEKLELRRLVQDKMLDMTADQAIKDEPAVRTAPDDHFIKCCIRIQSWIRGFICRRQYQVLKQTAHSLVSLIRPDESADLQAIYGRQYPMRKQDQDTGTVGLSEGRTLVIHGQEYQQCGAQEEYAPITTSPENIHGKSQSPEEILTLLTSLAESGSMQDFRSCLDKAKSHGLIDEASEVEDQLIQRKENVESWLEQVVHGWDTTRGKIDEEIREAKRLDIFPILSVVEAIISAREKEIHDNLEASITRASRRDYGYWMRKAKNFGLKDTNENSSKSFQRTVKMVRNGLKREAKLGTKEKYVVLFKNALSLGLQSDVNLALKIVLKRVLQVIKRALLLECTSTASVDSREQDWSRVEMEAAELGLDSQYLAKLRQTIVVGRSFESVQRIWTTTFEANNTGGPLKIFHEKCNSVDAADSIHDGPECQLAFNMHEFATSASMSLSAVSKAPSMSKSGTLWSLPQNWLEMSRLQRSWQEHTLRLRTLVIDNSNDLQHGGYACDCLPAKCAKDEKRESTAKNADIEHRPIGCLDSDKDSREEEEGFAELSECEKDLRVLSQAQISGTPEHQRNTPRKITLTRQMLEEKLNCDRAELRWVMKLDLTDEHIKSLGRAQICRWCPRVRVLTVDMNMLTTLKGVFHDGEDTIKQLSLKDNLLRDMVGLECLHRLNVLHLDGNLLSQLGFPCSSHVLSNDKGKKERNANMSLMSKNSCSPTPPLGGRSLVEYCWPRLKVLTIGRNRLTKICKIGNLCPNLEVLDVGSNQIFSLGGNGDNSLAGLHHLRELDVGQNRLQGKSLWKGLDNCPEIMSLVASRNKLREFPNHFGSVMLREIWLNGNAIKRLSCKAWLPSLQRLYLQDNMIDTLESLWGCPALEVLDLSFNSLSELSHLRHLSCFPCLRSLQLNDNPVSEHDHAAYVLEAVPWLAELDNEAVTKASRDRAVTRIFKNTMDVIGLEFLKEKLQRGEALLHGFSIPSGAPKSSHNSIEQSGSNPDQFLSQQDFNTVLNGEASEGVLWQILSEAKTMASSSSIMQYLLAANAFVVKFEGLHSFSKSELEARSNTIAYKQMSFGLKGRVHAATKETCFSRLLKEWDQSVPCHLDRGRPIEDSCLAVPFLNLSSESHFSCDKAGESNREWCLEEHTMFDSNTCREGYRENTEYKLQLQAQVRRVTRLQALVRGHLTRIQFKLLNEQKTAMCQEQEHKCACKIQAVWRGWRARRAQLLDFRERAQLRAALTIQAHWRGHSMRLRFRRALGMAKYTDDDDFEYASIDDGEFLAGERALCAAYQPTESTVATISNPAISSSETMLTTVEENPQALAVTDGVEIKPAQWDTHCLQETDRTITLWNGTFQAPLVPDREGIKPEKWDAHGLPTTKRLTCPFEFDTRGANDTAPPLIPEDDDSSHVIEVCHQTLPTDIPSLQTPESLTESKDKVCATHSQLERKPTGLQILKENEAKQGKTESEEKDMKEESTESEEKKTKEENKESEENETQGKNKESEEKETKEENKESESKDIAELLRRIRIKSTLNVRGSDGVSKGLVISDEVSRIVKGHLEEISQPSTDPKNTIKPDEGDPSSISAAEVQMRATAEALAKDWGFKYERTGQALLKARQRTQQKAKDAAHKNAQQGKTHTFQRMSSFIRKEIMDQHLSGNNAQTIIANGMKKPSLDIENASGVTDPDQIDVTLSFFIERSSDSERRLKRFREKVEGQIHPMGAPPRRFEKRASLSFSGLTLQMPMDKQESCRLPEPEIFHTIENNLRKPDGSYALPVPRQLHQQRKGWCAESFESKRGMLKHPIKSSTRDLSAIHLPKMIVNSALQVSPATCNVCYVHAPMGPSSKFRCGIEFSPIKAGQIMRSVDDLEFLTDISSTLAAIIDH